jgi:hypothetical protein
MATGSTRIGVFAVGGTKGFGKGSPLNCGEKSTPNGLCWIPVVSRFTPMAVEQEAAIK